MANRIILYKFGPISLFISASLDLQQTLQGKYDFLREHALL